MKTIQILLFLGFSFLSYSQSQQVTSSEIFQNIEQFANTGTVMYIAAHPDDENTRLISWLTNAQHYNTVYLSLTRGDGGQNLIGTEKGKLLGLLRTQELLEARKIDGGKQWFTRANDFGYSKTATETLEIWDEEKILGDVVWAIRKHQPHVLITRFDPDSNGRTHGHHTASAQLAVKAFDLAGDPSAYAEQLKFVNTWQPKRLFFNTSWWFYGSREAFEKADKSKMLSVDVGEYLPMLGRSNNEIAALSRSKHACQGFGAELQRGSQEEWLRLLKGDMPDNGNLMQGINTDLRNYSSLYQTIEKVKKNFDFKQPDASVPTLISIAKQVENKLPGSELKQRKLREIHQLILDASGIYMEWTTREEFGVPTDSIATNFEVTNRGEIPVSVVGNEFITNGEKLSIKQNESIEVERNYNVSGNPASTPYWLKQPMSGIGTYAVEAQSKIGQPENDPPVQQKFLLDFEAQDFQLPVEKALQYKTIDPAKGEIYEPFYVVPPVAVNIPNSVYLFANDQPQTIPVEVTGFADNIEGKVNLEAGLDWMISEAQAFSIEQAGGTQTVYFQVIPPANQVVNELKATVKLGNTTYFDGFSVVNYDHIEKQMVFQPASAVIERLNLVVPNVKVAYIQGSGDEVPEALRQIGLNVNEITVESLTETSLNNYDVVVLGIRAFNTQNELAYKKDLLWEFARKGGTVISQYNTTRGLVTDEVAPYPLRLSRDRISQEKADLTILEPQHPVISTPNKITGADFNNWIQERGLYFADEWDEQFTPILEGYDTGENAKQGMLLVAPVGEGHYVYTGLSFFRELPAGVPGAYRLFVNLLSLDADE